MSCVISFIALTGGVVCIVLDLGKNILASLLPNPVLSFTVA
jgi:hypothetical protein